MKVENFRHFRSKLRFAKLRPEAITICLSRNWSAFYTGARWYFHRESRDFYWDSKNYQTACLQR